MKRKQNIIAFWIAFIYMLFSTYLLFSIIYNYNISLPNILSGFLFPGLLIGFSVGYGGVGLVGIIIAQIITFGIIYLILRIIVQYIYALLLFIKNS
jgi:hypothetical protein